MEAESEMILKLLIIAIAVIILLVALIAIIFKQINKAIEALEDAKKYTDNALDIYGSYRISSAIKILEGRDL